MVVPPLVAQRAIADYLDRETARIDALIAAKRRMVELLEERSASDSGRRSSDLLGTIAKLAARLVKRHRSRRSLMARSRDAAIPDSGDPVRCHRSDSSEDEIRSATARSISETTHRDCVAKIASPTHGDVVFAKTGARSGQRPSSEELIEPSTSATWRTASAAPTTAISSCGSVCARSRSERRGRHRRVRRRDDHTALNI